MRLRQTIKERFPAIVPIVRWLRLVMLTRPINLMPRRGVQKPESISAIFKRVYKRNYWGNANSRSGSGSDLTQTVAIRSEIPKLVHRFGVKTVLDIPCGDFFWMKECKLGVDSYVGADIVPDMIKNLSKTYGTSQRRFEVLDLTDDLLPRSDLVFCRDVLVHFSFADISRVIANLKRSGSKYLLATTFVNRTENFDISTSGDWRPLNLQRPPLSFPEPLYLINERCTEFHDQFADKSLGLWRIADL